tara:strand:- start:177 stop:1016 length:840 start_codon:yes stop_codon:yes gene_type:complete
MRFLLPFAGITLFAYLLFNLSWQKVWTSVMALKWWQLLLPAVCASSGIFIKAIRWSLLLGCDLDKKKQARDIFLASVFYGMVTPGRVGEFVKVQYLKDLGYTYRAGLFYTIYDRFFDIMILCTFGAFACFIFGFCSIWFLALILFILFGVARLHFKIANIHLNGSVSGIKYTQLCLITISAYLIYAAGLPIILGVVNVAEFLTIILAVLVGNLVSLIPLSFHGLGTRESVFFLFLDWFSNEVLMVASITHFFTSFFGTAIFCSLYLGVGLMPNQTNSAN